MFIVARAVSVVLVFIAAAAWSAPSHGQTPSATASTGRALESIFDPWRAPANKTMGLAQRSFVDLVEASQGELQIALVVDGTSSMGTSLDGIRGAMQKMVDDLGLYREAKISLQLVVFRDVGAGEKSVEFPLHVAGKKFTTDVGEVRTALAELEAFSGAPYFPEMIDAGIHAAISELEWSTDTNTSRWILLFGDAPPYDVGFDDPTTKARRQYDTSYLASVAERKGIKINCVLCASREEERTAYERVLDKTRQFMATLATESGGLMLDLSYPDIRKAIDEAAQKSRVRSVRIGRITEDEIRDLREQAEREKSLLAQSRRVKIAVLPHLPLDSLSFDPEREEVRIAADLREKLRRIPGIDVKSTSAVKRQWEILSERGVRGENMLQTLATVLDVDYVLWGEVVQENNVRKVSSTIFEAAGNRKLAGSSAVLNSNAPTSEATSQLTRGLVTQVLRERNDARLSLAFAFVGNPPANNELILTPVANVPSAEKQLLVGYEALEQASEYLAGDPQADPLLEQAQKALEAAIGEKQDAENALAQLLLANCYFNQAQSLAQRQQTSDADAKMVQFRATLNQAYRHMNRLQRPDVKTEIKADHLLLSQKSPSQRSVQEAIDAYASLTKVPTGSDDRVSSSTALRAHWMLAGIYSGDWGVPEEVTNPALARDHLAQILAHWPDSSEAKFIKTKLRWDSQMGANSLEHFPRAQESALLSEGAAGGQ